MIKPAQNYHYTDELCIISSFYNSNSYITKPINYQTFIKQIETANLNYLIVECAFGKQPFTLQKSNHIIQVRTSDVMWQKERLLNIALEHLPAKCKKVAWLDCDIVFENPDWALETVIKLKTYKVVQPFKHAIRLPKGMTYYDGKGESYPSFGFVINQNPYIINEGRFDLHGHTGFAWASHRSILQKYGFYDACIAGSGDHMMAHSFAGDWTTKCISRVIGKNDFFYRHYLDWSKKIYEAVKAKISYVDGTLLHLWHGDIENRKYVTRQRNLEESNFNPRTDIVLNRVKCWKWNHQNEELKKWAEEYFILRKED